MAGHSTSGGTGQYSAPDARGEAEPPAPEQEAVDRVDEIVALRTQVAELEDRWRRTAAELDNLHKRAARDTEWQRRDERGRVAGAWLPVVDNLDLALRHADADPDSIVQGVRAVHEQALTVLAGLGFPRRHDDLGLAFDPARHEAVSARVDHQAEPGTVVEVVRPGYGDGDRQLRPAAVVVAAPKLHPAEQPGDSGQPSDGDEE